MAAQVLDLALMLDPTQDAPTRAHAARLAARLGYVAVHLPVEPGASASAQEVDALIEAAQPAMVVVDDGAATPGVVRRNDVGLVRQARAAIDEAEDDRPLIVAVPVSIGRTLNEAVARADRDPRMRGDAHPQATGIFGTIEQAQEQVLDLARAGAEILLVTVPSNIDIADVLAQVRSLVVGATPHLLGR